MDARQRSPSYPSTPLGEAIEIARKLYQSERTNTVDRDVAAKAMGYSGISGRSATILSNLIQYGLIAKVGKNEVKVTPRAVELLYPDSDATFADALHDAANEPDLFQQINERFPDARPSEAALEAFLVKRGFTFAALPPAIRAYRETFSYIEDMIVSERTVTKPADVIESQSNQRIESSSTMNQPQRQLTFSPLPHASGAILNVAQSGISLGGMLETQAEADELIAKLNALKSFLKVAPEKSLLPTPIGDKADDAWSDPA